MTDKPEKHLIKSLNDLDKLFPGRMVEQTDKPYLPKNPCKGCRRVQDYHDEGGRCVCSLQTIYQSNIAVLNAYTEWLILTNAKFMDLVILLKELKEMK